MDYVDRLEELLKEELHAQGVLKKPEPPKEVIITPLSIEIWEMNDECT